MSTTDESITCICGKTFRRAPDLNSHIRGKARNGDYAHFASPESAEALGRLVDHHIPVHPQPGFFETTEVVVGGSRVGPEQVEQILASQPWSIDPLKHNATRALVQKGWVTWRFDNGLVCMISPASKARLERDAGLRMAPHGVEVIS